MIGNLFHSAWNREWDKFTVYLQRFKEIAYVLTKGNQDILPEALLHQLSHQVVNYLQLGDHFILLREPLTDIPIETLKASHLIEGSQNS